jgi:hypothetical protein
MTDRKIKPMNESRGTHVPHSIIQPPPKPQHRQQNMNEQEPDTHLITAAPEMLEALKGMIELAEEWFLRGYRPKEDYWRNEDFMIWRSLSYESNRFQAARAAIAKAEGRQG